MAVATWLVVAWLIGAWLVGAWWVGAWLVEAAWLPRVGAFRAVVVFLTPEGFAASATAPVGVGPFGLLLLFLRDPAMSC